MRKNVVISILFMLGFFVIFVIFLSNSLKLDKDINESNINYIFVGDSRFVDMQKVADNDIFISKYSEGYDYFCEHFEIIKNSYTENSVIVIGMGVNDLWNIDLYAEKINELAQDYNVVFLSVNPIDEEKCKNAGIIKTNEEIDIFNNEIKEKLSENILFLDSNSYLKENGFKSPDGLHYNKKTYSKIYKFIKQNIENQFL